MKILQKLFFLSFTLLCLVASGFAADATAPTDDGKISVIVQYFTNSEGPSQYSAQTEVRVKNGTPAIEIVKLAGLEKRLTNSAVLKIVTYPSVNNREEKTLAAAVDVGAVRAGKAKDFPVDVIPGAHAPAIGINYGDFDFSGGSPNDFAAKLVEVYGVDWKGIQIPRNLENVRVPAFRKESLKEDWDDASTPAAVVALYNSIASRYPSMGNWTWEGSIYKPEIVMLISNKDADAPAQALKVKALPLAGIPDKKWEGLENDLANAQDAAKLYQQLINGADGTNLDGRISIQRDSKILVIIGTPAYIEMVESLVAAYEKNGMSELYKPDAPPIAAKP